jgi:hypothetical protein
MESVPMDGTPVLVLLAEESHGSRIHVGTFLPNIAIIGNHFTWDIPAAIAWTEAPSVPQCNPVVDKLQYRNCLYYALAKTDRSVTFQSAHDWGSTGFKSTFKCPRSSWDAGTPFELLTEKE